MAQEWREVLKEEIILPTGKVIALGRTRTSKTKQLYVDGQPTYNFSLDITIGPKHYKDDRGQYQDIHTKLLPSNRSIVGFGNPAFEMIENEYEMFVLGALNSGVPLVRYATKNTEYWVQFAAHNLQWTNDLDQIELISTPATIATEVSDNEAKWPNAYGIGIGLRFVADMGRMSKWLDIDSLLPDPPQFIIDGGNPALEFSEILSFHPDLEVWVNGEKWDKKKEVSTASEIEFRSPDGKVQFVFPIALGYDEGTDESPIPLMGQLHLRKQGNKLYVTTRFFLVVLQAATYPIHLDATATYYPAASADDTTHYRSGTNLYAYPECFIYGDTGGGGYGYRNAGVRFVDVTIPQAATIITAYVSIYQKYVTKTGWRSNIYAHDVDDAGNFVTIPYVWDATYRPRTTATIYLNETWNVETWHDITGLEDIIQEVVDRPGWTSGNAIAILMLALGDQVGEAAFQAYDFGSLYPELHMEWSVPAVGQPTHIRTQGIPTGSGFRQGGSRWN